MIGRLILLASAISAPAAAAPTYLSCKVDGQPDYELQVTADEANSAVTLFVVNTGWTQKLPAVFSPGDLRFGDRVGAYRIDRTTLQFERTMRIVAEVDRGKCTVKQAPKRAF